jgi:hypothetical protein
MTPAERFCALPPNLQEWVLELPSYVTIGAETYYWSLPTGKRHGGVIMNREGSRIGYADTPIEAAEWFLDRMRDEWFAALVREAQR